jgi:hypothetical protein
MSRNLAVQTVPTRLYHVSLSKERLKDAAYAIMSLFLFPSESDWFFNYTSTYEEVSMIVNGEALKLFPPHTLKVVSKPWRALAIIYGSYGLPVTENPISELSHVLAKAGISIYYLSTGNSDYILVPEDNLPAAMNSLKDHFQMIAGERCESTTVDVASLKQEIVEVKCSEVFNKKSSNLLECTVLNEELHICSLHKESRSECALALLRLIFKSNTYFFSFTETEDEISLMVENKELKGFSPDITISDGWRPIQRFKKTSLSEVGVISALSKPITSAKIPIVYLSTFCSAYIFVQSKHFAVTKLVLENSGFKIGTLQDRLAQNALYTEKIPTNESNGTGTPTETDN